MQNTSEKPNNPGPTRESVVRWCFRDDCAITPRWWACAPAWADPAYNARRAVGAMQAGLTVALRDVTPDAAWYDAEAGR